MATGTLTGFFNEIGKHVNHCLIIRIEENSSLNLTNKKVMIMVHERALNKQSIMKMLFKYKIFYNLVDLPIIGISRRNLAELSSMVDFICLFLNYFSVIIDNVLFKRKKNVFLYQNNNK